MNNLRELRISERNTQPAPGSRSIIQVTASSATKKIPLRIYRPYDPTNRSTSAIAILKALLQPLDLTGVKSVTIKAFYPDPFHPSGQDPVEWRKFLSRMAELETLTIINSRASIILGALVPDVWPWREIADPVEVKERMVLICPRLKEILLGNIESPWDTEEVIEMVNSRQKHGAPLADVFVEGVRH